VREASLQAIYLALVEEAVARLTAAERFLASSPEVVFLESAILQLRKSLELNAFAAIAPDKKKYEALRAGAAKDPDFTKDYHAAKIFAALQRVNPDFYPLALTPAVRQPSGVWHYDRKQSGYLTKKQFERTYDRLGKQLHSHNPWSSPKNIQNLRADLPGIIARARGLVQLHARVIRTSEFEGVWVVEANPKPVIITGAGGSFVVRAG
jgi:hypothetical protein